MSVILVTGSSTGIGQETALHLARAGHEVYASVRNPDSATELHEKIASESLPVTVIRLDLVDPASIDSAVTQVLQSSGRLDALVANAGIGAGSSVEETPMETVREIFETNYFGNVSLLRAVAPAMRTQRGGTIVMVGSLAGRYAAGCHGHYSASKWAMEGLCESLAQEMAEFGARVSIIEPGCVMTPMWTKVEPSAAPPLYPVNVQRLTRFFETGLGQPAMPAEVAEAIEAVITGEKPPFRVPVGKDATEVIAGRERAGGEAWIDMLCTPGDDAFADAWTAVVGVDYFRD
ncbi:MAG: short-chain dehydrogenase/reductase [Halioglobus sp.]|nr:short-chain dehydrogenase/reductase [Halioglobus sp.]|tara:strand:+ start:480 stop:1349 length:870 start_codon:yes stop_codon:yes gene_type:complete